MIVTYDCQNIFIVQATYHPMVKCMSPATVSSTNWDEMAKMLGESLGIAISNGREPSRCLGQVFNFKFGSFVSKQCYCMACTQPLLDLKTRPRFCPVS